MIRATSTRLEPLWLALGRWRLLLTREASWRGPQPVMLSLRYWKCTVGALTMVLARCEPEGK